MWDGTEWQTVAADGQDGNDGQAGEDGQAGADGTNGVTPHIDVGGNWFIGETDTGIPATGPAGNDGIEPVTVLPSPVVALAGKVYFLTADDGTKKAGTTWKCVADDETYIFQQIQTDLSSLTDTTEILAGKVDKVTGYGLSTNDYTNDDKTAVGKINLETLATLSGTEVSVAPWTQSVWSASGICTLTATGWAASGRQAAYIVITLAAGSTPSVVGTEEVEDGDALSEAGVYECFLKNVDGKIYFRQISFTGAVA